ncbi:putative transcription regulator [Feldmannia species virus]|uniref:Putative transcription regulator n=1 Tax=Feldmannia species virus TaxID=39420 RepID=B5LWK4_9PHYC|nr:putative transcription regulator [Feldmannia species virus]ACH46867.1 putative transcription regulator [Feldmannia species virus]
MTYHSDQQYLCEAVDGWQRNRIVELENDALQYTDMVWKLDDGETYLRDCRSAYTCSSFMRTLFETTVGKGEKSRDEVPMYRLSEKSHIFAMIRVFCHTGLVRFGKSDTILRTIERYAAFQFYGIEIGSATLKRLVLDSLGPSNSMVAFEYAVHRQDRGLLQDIVAYIRNYAFLVFRQKSFLGIRRESLAELVHLCDSDSLNVPEIDLLSHLIRLCEKKLDEKEFTEFDSPFAILTHREWGTSGKSLFDALRLSSLSMEEFMSLALKHPGAMNNDQIVQVMRAIHRPEGSSKKRKKFQIVSAYPRNLTFHPVESPQMEVSYCQRDKVLAHYVFQFLPKKDVSLPTLNFGSYQIRITVVYRDKVLGISGQAISPKQESRADLRITASMVNFRHDRWKKSTTALSGSVFQIPNILSCNAIEGSSGYLFDVAEYPDFSDGGSCLMLSLACESL